MDEFEELKERLHENTLEEELTRLRWRKANDREFTLQKLRIMIDSEVRRQDDGARDRGDIHHIENQARMAAMEILYHEWRKEAAC